MIIRIDPESDVPIYTQLSNQMIEGIARGQIKPGDSLPSVRAFAADLGVNMHTVNKSYHDLEKRGIIKIIPKSGAVIRTQTEHEQNQVHSERLQTELKTVVAEALVLGMEENKIQSLVTSIIQDLNGTIHNP